MRKLLITITVLTVLLFMDSWIFCGVQPGQTRLTHGPILSTSSDCSQMYVFCRVVNGNENGENAGSFRIAYREMNREKWQYTEIYDTKTENDFTAIARFRVESKRKYQYQIVSPDKKNLLSGQFAFISLPKKEGEFVFYHVTDSHGQNNEWPVNLLAHYREGYRDLPAAVLYTGDIFEIGAKDFEADFLGSLRKKYKTLYSAPAIAELFSQVPLFHMWDDWDFAGDNSCNGYSASRGFMKFDRSIPLKARREYVPNPASFESHETAAFFVTIANNLIVVADSRSKKAPLARQEEGRCQNLLDGSQSKDEAPCWGRAQLEDIKQVFISHKNKTYKNFLVSTQSFVDNLRPPAFPCDGRLMGERDSFGVFHKDERNDLLRFIQTEGIEMIVLSGDDHKPKITYRDFWHEPYPVKKEPVIAKDITVGLFEFKAGNGGSTTRIFDSAEFPPYWWAGCADEYTEKKPVRGYGNLVRKDVGFCFHIINEGQRKQCRVQAVLLEDEAGLCKVGGAEGTGLRKAPCVVYEDDFSRAKR